MLDIKFKKCCYECNERITYTKEDTLLVMNTKGNVYTEVGCQHQEVCKEYRESDKED